MPKKKKEDIYPQMLAYAIARTCHQYINHVHRALGKGEILWKDFEAIIMNNLGEGEVVDPDADTS